MQVLARVRNARDVHSATVATDAREQSIPIASKRGGFGSSVNGGELLALALATCYCNDIYREATARGITVHAVDIEVTGEFGGRGEPAAHLSYRASVTADARPEEIQDLLEETDRVAEIQNTVRRGCSVQFASR